VTDLSRLSLEELHALRERTQSQINAPGSSPSLRRNPPDVLQKASLEELIRMREELNPAYQGGRVSVGPFDTGIKTSPGADRFISGGGKAFMDPIHGAGQVTGLISQDEVDETKRLEKPLMRTGEGKFGNIVGSGIAAAPFAAIRGANTVVGAGLVGGGLGFMEPVATGESRLRNTTRGAMFSSAVPAAAAVLKSAKALSDPLREGGQEAIVRDTMKRFATDPEKAAQSLQNPQQFIPDSKPTVAEATLDPGLATLQRGAMSSDPQIAGAFATRDQANNAARLSALSGIAKDDASMEAAKTARSAASDPLYEAAKNFKVKSNQTLKYLLDRPSMKDAWVKAQRLARESGESLVEGVDAPASQTTTGILDSAGREITREVPEQSKMYSGRALHYMKMALDDLSDPGAASGIGRTEQRAITSTKASLLGWMDQNIPDYGKARKAFQEGSKPINQMEVGQYLKNKMQPALADYGAVPRTRAETYATALRDAEQTTRNATGFQSQSLNDVMEPDQMAILNGIAQDLARRAAAQDIGKIGGSATAQHLSSQNLMRQVAGPLGMPMSWAESGLLGTAARPLDWLMKKQDPIIQQKLAEVLLDPARARALLLYATKRQPAFAGLLNQYLPVVAGAGLLSQSE
jgi:hypothetical protein